MSSASLTMNIIIFTLVTSMHKWVRDIERFIDVKFIFSPFVDENEFDE
jgi:hypothetical protein